MLSSSPEYSTGCRSTQRIPSAATSEGSQSDWSSSGAFAANPSEKTGTSIRKQLTAIRWRCNCFATSIVARSRPTLAIP